MRRFIVALALGLTACGDLQPTSQALAPAPSSVPAASPTPLPSGVVDPQPLLRQETRIIGGVLRVDDAAAKLVSTADFLGTRSIVAPAVNAPATVWVIAIVGDFRQIRGVLRQPNSQCRLSAYWAHTGEVWSTAQGPLSMCQPYFARSLTPPDAPVGCAPNGYDNGVMRDQPFSKTRRGTFTFTSVRDDTWGQPTIVRGAFLAQSPEGSVTYENAFCMKAFVRRSPVVETLLASAVGATVPQQMPPLEWAIWLRGYHAVSGWADDNGHFDVVVEPRAGYEWAFFDWHSLVPDGGYIALRFLDAAGNEVLPWRIANGP